jgi:hypothetical protein
LKLSLPIRWHPRYWKSCTIIFISLNYGKQHAWSKFILFLIA